VGREIDRTFGKCVQRNVMKFVGRKLCDIFISMMFVKRVAVDVFKYTIVGVFEKCPLFLFFKINSNCFKPAENFPIQNHSIV
jgi:hypothetical protein